MAKTVVVLGATANPDRYAYRAMRALLHHGYHAVPVNPTVPEVLGQPCFKTVSEVKAPIDTVTMYVGAARSEPLIPDILAAKPRRIVFNPGAENDNLAAAAEKAGIEVARGCTLVMLHEGTF
jgi:predicted CoA-binding protein